MKISAIGLLALVSLVTASCGGGSSSSNPIAPTAASPPSLTGTWSSAETPEPGQTETLAGILTITQSGSTVTITPQGGSSIQLQLSGNTLSGQVARNNGTIVCSVTIEFSSDGRTGDGTETCPNVATTIPVTLTKIS